MVIRLLIFSCVLMACSAGSVRVQVDRGEWINYQTSSSGRLVGKVPGVKQTLAFMNATTDIVVTSNEVSFVRPRTSGTLILANDLNRRVTIAGNLLAALASAGETGLSLNGPITLAAPASIVKFTAFAISGPVQIARNDCKMRVKHVAYSNDNNGKDIGHLGGIVSLDPFSPTAFFKVPCNTANYWLYQERAKILNKYPYCETSSGQIWYFHDTRFTECEFRKVARISPSTVWEAASCSLRTNGADPCLETRSQSSEESRPQGGNSQRLQFSLSLVLIAMSSLWL